ncbi:MAG: type II secretion system protein GspM [Methylococcaceae bacterium]
MKQILLQLSLRERVLLIGGISVLFISGFYAFTYMPIIDEQQRLKTAIEAQRQLQNYLQGISAEAAASQMNTPEVTESADTAQSLIGIIDSGSEQSGLKPAVKRLIPEGPDQVTLWLEQCDADKLFAWLAVLDKEHAVTVQQITVSREQGGEGLVSGKALLSRSPH